MPDNHEMAKQDDYIRITTRIPPEVHDALVELANRTERSLNGELVARLQVAIALAQDELRPHTARQKTASYDAADPVGLLIEKIRKLPEDRQRALLVLLK